MNLITIHQLKKIKPLVYLAVIIAFSFLITEFAFQKAQLKPLENVYYDLWHQLAGKQHNPKHVVIVAIDDRTLEGLADEPLAFWGPRFAEVIRTLRESGVRCIGIDFIFRVSPEAWLRRLLPGDTLTARTFDATFREQLNTGDVILAAGFYETPEKQDDGALRFHLPIDDYRFALPGFFEDIGLVNLMVDGDEVVRSFAARMVEGAPDTSPVYAFGPLLAARALNRQDMLTDTRPRPIHFAGPPGTFRRISFQTVLKSADGDPALRDILEEKVVIIAEESTGMQDFHLTPYTRVLTGAGANLMSGPEIHANIVETLISGHEMAPVSAGMRRVWLLAWLTAGTILFYRHNPVYALAWLAAICLVCAGCGYAVFRLKYLLPVAAVQLALGISYLETTAMRLTREERAHRRIKRAMRPYVSDEVLREMIRQGKPPDLGGELREVTVLFSDIRNFTTFSELLTPQEVVEMLNEYFNRICPPILERGGMIDKFVGDAVMAVFGAPSPYPDHARRAAEAACAIKDIAGRFDEWVAAAFPGRHLPRFNAGVGLHTGDAVIGNVGSSRRMGYTAIGDTVNIAARMESFSKILGWTVVATRRTVEHAGPSILIGEARTVQVKGRAGEVEAVEIIGVAPSDTTADTPGGDSGEDLADTLHHHVGNRWRAKVKT